MEGRVDQQLSLESPRDVFRKWDSAISELRKIRKGLPKDKKDVRFGEISPALQFAQSIVRDKAVGQYLASYGKPFKIGHGNMHPGYSAKVIRDSRDGRYALVVEGFRVDISNEMIALGEVRHEGVWDARQALRDATPQEILNQIENATVSSLPAEAAKWGRKERQNLKLKIAGAAVGVLAGGTVIGGGTAAYEHQHPGTIDTAFTRIEDTGESIKDRISELTTRKSGEEVAVSKAEKTPKSESPKNIATSQPRSSSPMSEKEIEDFRRNRPVAAFGVPTYDRAGVEWTPENHSFFNFNTGLFETSTTVLANRPPGTYHNSSTGHYETVTGHPNPEEH